MHDRRRQKQRGDLVARKSRVLLAIITTDFPFQRLPAAVISYSGASGNLGRIAVDPASFGGPEIVDRSILSRPPPHTVMAPGAPHAIRRDTGACYCGIY